MPATLQVDVTWAEVLVCSCRCYEKKNKENIVISKKQYVTLRET